jgi:hypothetical protein
MSVRIGDLTHPIGARNARNARNMVRATVIEVALDCSDVAIHRLLESDHAF